MLWRRLWQRGTQPFRRAERCVSEGARFFRVFFLLLINSFSPSPAAEFTIFLSLFFSLPLPLTEQADADDDDLSGSWYSAGASGGEGSEEGGEAEGESPGGLDAYLKASDAKWKKGCVRWGEDDGPGQQMMRIL
jgi:hypothetical protein